MTSKFQQRHYEAIAEVIQAVKDDIHLNSDNDTRQLHGVAKVQATLSRLFKADNTAFDTDRFARACFPGANAKNRVK